MTLEHWIKLYNKKTKNKFERDERYELFYKPDKGFCEIGMSEDMVFIRNLCGDARFWRCCVENVGRMCGIHHGGTTCIRKEIRAYIRLFGFHVDQEVTLSDGTTQYLCTDKRTGLHGQATPSFYFKDTGIQAYSITWEF